MGIWESDMDPQYCPECKKVTEHKAYNYGDEDGTVISCLECDQ